MRLFTQFAVLAAILLLPFLSYSQCSVDIAQGSVLTVNCGDDVMINTPNGFGNSYMDDFNGGAADTNLWQQVAGAAFNNPCNNSPSNSTYLWMDTTNTGGGPRLIATVPLDLSCGGTVCFDFKMGEQGTPSPCEGPDLAADGIYLEYSTTGGASWNNWYFFNPDTACCGCPSGGCAGMAPSPFISWNNYCFNIPAAAQTSSTMIRIIQPGFSAPPFDHWGVDEFEVNTGCQGYTLLWSTNDTLDTVNLTGVTADTTLWVVKTDGINTCTDSITVLVDSIQFNPQASLYTVCSGATVQLDMNTANASGLNSQTTYTYQWTPASGLNNPAQAVTDATVSNTTTYTASITHPTSPGCTASEDVTVTVANTLSIDSVLVTDEHCGATASIGDGSISIFASGGSGGLLYDIGTNQGSNSVWTGLSAQSYNLIVQDTLTSCTVSTSITIPLNPGPVVDSLSSTNILCNGDCNATAAVFSTGSTGNTSYTWTGLQGGSASGSQVSGLCADTWTVEIQDDFCTVLSTVTITEPTAMVISETANQSASCSDVADGFANITTVQGTAPYTYFWPALGVSSPGTGLQLAGTYDCIVTDQNGCTAVFTATIGFDNVPPVVDLGPDATACIGETVLIPGPIGMASYQWQDGTTTTDYLATQPGQYSVVVVDSNGCSGTDSLMLSQYPAVPQPNLGNDTILTGDSLVLDAGSGYSAYNWISPTASNGQTRTATSSGNYIVQVTDANGCVAFDTINVIIYPTGIENPGALSAAQVFPNPTTGIVEATLPGLAGKAITITITNALGQTVLQQNATPNSSERITLDLTGREKGVYFLQVLHEQEDRTFRLVLK